MNLDNCKFVITFYYDSLILDIEYANGSIGNNNTILKYKFVKK